MATNPPALPIISWLNRPVSIAPLVTFRMLFGLLMLGSTIRFWALGWIGEHFVEPVMHFHYFGFHWVQPLPGFGMYVVHALMILAAAGIMLGAWYRVSAIIWAIGFIWCELIDITWYLNHYYFVSLVSVVMIFLPAQRSLSVDVWRRPERAVSEVPRWVILLPQMMLSMVYFFAGWAKINSDWLLRALPLRIWLPAHTDLPLIGGLLRFDWTAFAFSWAGMLYDSLIPIFLWWRKTRVLAYLAVVVFHAVTGLLFQIGVFPVVMIGLTTVFFSENWHLRWQTWIRNNLKLPAERGHWQPAFPRLAGVTVALFVLFQVLFPWRYLLYDGNLFWNEEGYRFSWRVMLVEKAGTATFYVKDPETGREGVVTNREFLHPHQEKQMSFQPDLILQFAHFLADHYAKPGLPPPEVRAEVYVTMNGAPSRLFIDPQVNLTDIRDSWKQKHWVLPYSTPAS